MKLFISLALIFVIPFCCGLGGLAGALNGQSTPQASTTSSTLAAIYPPPAVPGAEMLYYTVNGATEKELSREIQLKGPQGYAAYTGWEVSWTWPGYGSLLCDVSSPIVDAVVTVTFPSWDPPAKASPELIEKWARFIAALAVHEQGHVDHVYESLPRIEAAIENADCLTAEAAAQEIIREMNQFDLDYDRETSHGRSQGAAFP